MLNVLALTVLLGLVTYRLTRLAILDSIFDAPRDAVHRYLLTRTGKVTDRLGVKLSDLLGCQFCISVWLAAIATVATDLVTDVPLPVWVWLGACSVALVAGRYIDPD